MILLPRSLSVLLLLLATGCSTEMSDRVQHPGVVSERGDDQSMCIIKSEANEMFESVRSGVAKRSAHGSAPLLGIEWHIRDERKWLIR